MGTIPGRPDIRKVVVTLNTPDGVIDEIGYIPQCCAGPSGKGVLTVYEDRAGFFESLDEMAYDGCMTESRLARAESEGLIREHVLVPPLWLHIRPA